MRAAAGVPRLVRVSVSTPFSSLALDSAWSTSAATLKLRSALRIGLIPALPERKIRYVGNAAALGAQLALMSEPERARAAALARRIEHVSLAARPDFQDIVVDCMNSPRRSP